MKPEQSSDVMREQRYVERWFWTIGQLAVACGCDEVTALKLIEARCAPGPIYAVDANGNWWSALEAGSGSTPAQPLEGAHQWFSPAAAWGLRIARQLMRDGKTPETAAETLKSQFRDRFADALARNPLARAAFPACFTAEGKVDTSTSVVAADSEWNDWIDGGYAVCLRVFTAETCIAKESLAASLKRQLASDADAIDMLAQAEALSGLILPFAPWQRPVGTPGVTIDKLLERLSLGTELPYD